MYMETSIIRDRKVISSFNFFPNEDLDLYLRSHEKGIGTDDWFAIENITNKEIAEINKLLQTDEEKKYFNDLKKGDIIDILLHFTVTILNG